MQLPQHTTRAYMALEEDLRSDIVTERLEGGQLIHSELELAERYKISRNTVRKALDNLVQEGLLRKIKGSGTFVVPRHERKRQPGKTQNALVRTRQIVFLSLSTALSEEVFRATFESIFSKLSKILQQRGYSLLFSHIDLDWAPPPCLINDDVSGVIFHGRITPEFWGKYIKPLPHVGIQHIDPRLESNWVALDNFSYSFQAMDHLMSLGHRRIGFVSNEIETQISMERYQGYLRSLEYLKLPFEENYAVTWQRPADNGVLKSEALLPPDFRPYLIKAFQGPNPPTAFICADDWRASWTIKALNEMGYRVPEDISVTGSNNCHSPSKGITGLIDKLDEICIEASKLLLEAIEEQNVSNYKTVLVRPAFQPGSTTAPAK